MLTEKLTRRALAVAILAALCLTVASPAHATVLSSLVNGDFETYTGDGGTTPTWRDVTVDNWNQNPAYTSGQPYLCVWNYAHYATDASYPTNPSNGALGFRLIRDASPVGSISQWIYQPIGTIEASDLGLRYALSAIAGCRADVAGEQADISVYFSTDVGQTAAGTILGSAGVGSVATTDANAVQFAALASNAAFTPNAANIGQTLYAVVGITCQTWGSGHGSGSAHDYFVDNVTLSSSPVPEPGTIILLGSGLIGLICYAWRKRR